MKQIRCLTEQISERKMTVGGTVTGTTQKTLWLTQSVRADHMLWVALNYVRRERGREEKGRDILVENNLE